MNTLHYDVAVIWSWAGGLTSWFWLHYTTGKNVVLIEKWRIGWDCTNTWCVPSKALIHYAKEFGKRHGGTATVQEALEYVRKKRQHFRDEESQEVFKKNYDLDVIHGHASFIDKNTLLVSGEEESHITADTIIIATWSHAYVPEIPLLDRSKIHTNETIFEITEELKELVIIWGGYIWCELWEAFANLWVDVTLIQRNSRLIPREEVEASDAMLKILEKAWVRVILNSTTSGSDWDNLIVTDKTTKQEIHVPYTQVLISTWRRANIWNLKLENAWVEFEKHGILVNDINKTSTKNIYALGDCVAHNPMFTHRADHEGRILVRNIFLKRLPKMSRTQNIVNPQVIYTTTEVARIGMTETELAEFYGPEEVRTYSAQIAKNDRHFLDDEDNGFVKIHYTRWSGMILWATMVMKNAGEMIHYLSLAKQQWISAHKLMRQIMAYPTHIAVLKKVVRPFVTDYYMNIKDEISYRLSSNAFKIIAWLIWAWLLGLFFWYKNTTWLTNNELANNVVQYLSTNSVWPLLFMTGYAVRWLIFFPAVIMTLIWGLLFWPIWWVIYTMIGENASATFSYIIGKKFGKSMVKPHNQWLFSKLSNMVKNWNLIDVFAARLVPMNFDIFNYFAGILNVPYKSYVIGTFLWILAPLIAVVLAWASLDVSQGIDFESFKLNKTYLTIAIILYVVSISLAVMVKKWMARKSKH